MHHSVAFPATSKAATRTISRLRLWVGRRAALLLIGSAAILAGAFFSWDWLVALGVAPLLLGALPCIAMCALGLCMSHAGRQACAKDETAPKEAAPDVSIRGNDRSASKETTS